jgi:phytoene synthase
MDVKTYPWEQRILEWAYEAFESPEQHEPVEVEDRFLEEAYRHCESVTKVHSRTFYMSSALLPADKRRAARALYALCRISDDLVDHIEIFRGMGDCPHDCTEEKLNTWRMQVLSEIRIHDLQEYGGFSPCAPVVLAWADTRARYGIPIRYVEQLIEGVSRDLVSKRYQTFEELAEYCYGVASTVGLMVMHIIGFSGPEAIPYAVKLGVALQLTNMLRDVNEDWQAGRLYLPQEELAAFNLTEADIAAGNSGGRWREFMRFQIMRNRRLYREALPGIAMLDPDGRFAISASAELYRAILDDIEAHDWDVFHRRAYIGTWGKLRRLPGIWWRSKTIA